MTTLERRQTGTVAPALSAEGIGKHFDGVAALTDCSLRLEAGEIHGLVGENGAGKSTLIKILTGAARPDRGDVRLHGERVQLRTPHDGHDAGVVALYQELAIVPTISVAENIYLGRPVPTRAGLINRPALHRGAAQVLRGIGQDHLDPAMAAGLLSPIQQTMVALARALAVDARVLILDEPTAALTDGEIPDLFRALRGLAATGVAVVYVTHRLEEVFELCERVTVMRNGRDVATYPTAATTVPGLIAAMIGRPQEALYPPHAAGSARGPLVLEAVGLSTSRLRDVSLRVHAGEILAVAGLAGSGRSQLLRTLGGAGSATAGTVRLHDQQLRLGSVRAALRAGIALVPEERRSQGLLFEASIERNICLTNLTRVSRGRVLVSPSRARQLSNDSIQDLSIKCDGSAQAVATLSGGNQQKVVLAKFLARAPHVLLLDEPTRGVDIGAKAEIYAILRRLADAGTAVVVVSSELPEVIGLADRIVALREGRLVGELPSAAATEDALLSMFYGRTAT